METGGLPDGPFKTVKKNFKDIQNIFGNVPCLVVDEEVDPLPHLCPARAGPAGVLADVEVRRLPNVEGGDVREAAVICQRRTKDTEKVAGADRAGSSGEQVGNFFDRVGKLVHVFGAVLLQCG